ncbi:MAG TPA: LysR family transcriptional regulator [Reyranella sp.]|nr:LysR family transcriptional regulator [Reyranella sp.]
MDWNDLRYALAVSRAGTLAAAARRLKVDQTTVARRLAAIERALGTRLFERIDGGLRPTRAGEAALARAVRIEQEIEGLERDIGGSDSKIAGTVRITAVPVLVNHLLVPASAALHAAHPELRLELIAESRNASLTRREADIALRLARPESGRSLLARRLGRVGYAVYGPRRKRARLPWISYEEGLAHLPQARWIESVRGNRETAPLALSDTESILQAVRAGLGKSLLPCFVADADPALRTLGDDKIVLTRELWVITHGAIRHDARIAVVVDWLDRLVKTRLS